MSRQGFVQLLLEDMKKNISDNVRFKQELVGYLAITIKLITVKAEPFSNTVKKLPE